MPYLPSGKPDPQAEHDLAFVVAARDDIPALVASVRRLEAELQALHSGRDVPRCAQDVISAEARERRAEYKARYCR